MNIRSWLLELSLKLFPVKEPPAVKVVYIPRNFCPDCSSVSLVLIRKGVWVCPQCVHESISMQVSPIVNTMAWYQEHPGMWSKQWRDYERKKREVKTMPL